MIVEFPQIDPVVISLFGLDVRWYALAYLVGFLAGWRYVIHLSKMWKLDDVFTKEHIDDFLVWAVVGAVLGGRIGYVLFYNLPYYADNPAAALQIWQGGMSFHGGMLGMIASMAAFAKFKKVPFLRLTDLIACAAPIGLFFGRIANFVNGELIGRPTNGEWGMVFSFAGDMPRHPSQLYEAALEGGVLFAILYFYARSSALKSRPGSAALIFLAGYGFFRFFIEYAREPDVQIGLFFNMFSMGQFLCAAMVAAAIITSFILRANQWRA